MAKAIPMIGRRFGRLKVLFEVPAYVHPSGQTARMFRVRCDCGNETTARGYMMREGCTKSCGCFHAISLKQKAKGRDFPNMIGLRVGRLTVLRRATEKEKMNRGPYRWYFVACDCGVQKMIAGYVLRRGNVVSCGCYSRERRIIHGEAHKTSEYQAWCGMIKRCENINSQDFADYGGRGITICKRWRKSYLAFLADMGRRPSSKHSLDRIKNEGNYTPKNCQWATPNQQANNRRKRKQRPI